MLIEDPRAALHGVLRSLKPGGRFAAAVWGPSDRVPFFSLPRSIAARELNLPPPPGPGLDAPPHPLRLGRPGMLDDLFREAGFEEVRSESVEVTFRFASAAGFVNLIRDMSYTMQRTLAEHDDALRERVWSGISAAAERHRDASGEIVLTNAAECVWGRRPAEA